MGFALETKRLILEDLVPDDLENVRKIAEDSRVMKYVLIWLENEKQIGDFFQHAVDESLRENRMGYILAIRIADTKEFAGLALIEVDPNQKTTAEVGCILVPEFWKTGYASEVLRALLAFGFERLGMHRIYGKCDEFNTASAHVLEKGGLRYEGTLREHVWLRDHWRSTKYYGMLAEEFKHSA